MSGETGKHTDDEYLLASPFEGDVVRLECHKVALVVTKKAHRCVFSKTFGPDHDIPTGTRAWRESAKVDGKFGSCYVCLPCLDRVLDPSW